MRTLPQTILLNTKYNIALFNQLFSPAMCIICNAKSNTKPTAEVNNICLSLFV